MTQDTKPRPARADEVESSLAFALCFDGRRRVHTADEMMARITAQRLMKYLEESGFALMKRLPSGDLSGLMKRANPG